MALRLLPRAPRRARPTWLPQPQKLAAPPLAPPRLVSPLLTPQLMTSPPLASPLLLALLLLMPDTVMAPPPAHVAQAQRAREHERGAEALPRDVSSSSS